MRRGVILGAVLAVLLPVAAAQAATPRPIVYAVVIDGLDGDRVDEGKAPFISSLLDGHATYYRESRSVMIAETNPNHVAMMTGAYGNTSGFPGNAFALYAPLAWVIIGGLVSSTLLARVVTPVLYARWAPAI